MNKYMVDSNIAGYLGEDDEPAMFTSWAEGWEYFQSFAREWADKSDELYNEQDCGHDDEESHTDECFGTDRAYVDSVLSEAQVSEKSHPTGYAFHITSNDGIVYVLWFALVEYDGPEK